MGLNKQIEQILPRINLRLLHYWQIYRFARSPLRKKKPLLIYQMGKVGSSTIRRSIDALSQDIHPYHLHYMSGIDYMVNICRKQSIPLQDHILASIYCKKLLKKASVKGERLNIITMVREPIVKNISQFFQSVQVSYPEFGYVEKAKKLRQEELTAEMIDFFIENFIHDDPLVWFDVELKQFTSIDVYETAFPHEKGYKIYENDLFRILLMRLENLSSCASEAMDSFLGFKNFTLQNENVSKEKEYAELYQKVKKEIRLPEAYIEKMYSSKMAQHFYTSSEIEKFKKKWRRL